MHLAADGTLSDRKLFVQLYQLGEAPDVFPDGIKLGPDGNFYIGLYSSPAILVVTPDGKIARRYTFASGGTPNMTFSADGKTMYVMAVDNTAGAPYDGRVLAQRLK